MYLRNTKYDVVAKVTHRLLDVLIEHPLETNGEGYSKFVEVHTKESFELLLKNPDVQILEEAPPAFVITEYHHKVTVENGKNVFYGEVQTITTY